MLTKRRTPLAGGSFESELGIAVPGYLVKLLGFAAAGFACYGGISLHLNDSGTWNHLAGASSVFLATTLFLISWIIRSSANRFPLNAITLMLCMYAARRAISMILALSGGQLPMIASVSGVNEYSFLASSTKAEFVGALSVVAFAAGWQFSLRRAKVSRTPSIPPEDRTTPLWAVYFVGLAAFYSDMLLGELFRNLGALVTTTSALASGAVFAMLLFSRRYGIGRGRALMPLLALLPLSANVLRTGMKSTAFEVLLPVILACFVRKMRAAILLTGFSVFLLLAFIYPYSQEFRARVWTQKEDAPASQIAADVIRNLRLYGLGPHMEQSVESFQARFGGIGSPGLVVMFADLYGQIGPEFLRNLPWAFVPRLIWPGKPAFEPAAYFTWYLGSSPSPEEARTATALHIGPELYWMFGWAGVALGMIGLGVGYGTINRWLLERAPKMPALMAVWYSFTMFVMFIEERRFNMAVLAPVIILVNGYAIAWVCTRFLPAFSQRFVAPGRRRGPAEPFPR